MHNLFYLCFTISMNLHFIVFFLRHKSDTYISISFFMLWHSWSTWQFPAQGYIANCYESLISVINFPWKIINRIVNFLNFLGPFKVAFFFETLILSDQAIILDISYTLIKSKVKYCSQFYWEHFPIFVWKTI